MIFGGADDGSGSGSGGSGGGGRIDDDGDCNWSKYPTNIPPKWAAVSRNTLLVSIGVSSEG